MEALQIIKYRRKKERVNLMSDWSETLEKVKLDEKMTGTVNDPNSSTSSAEILAGLLVDPSEGKMKAALVAIDQEDELFE
jgi:hypothetical protein